MNFVFFDADSLNSHSNNDYAGARLFDRMKPGDIVTVRKHLERRRFTVAAVDRADVNLPRLKLVERVSQTIRDNYDEWSIET